MSYVTLEDYVVRVVTERAVGLRDQRSEDDELVWVPRSQCDGGDWLAVGDEDVCVRERTAIEKGLRY